MSYYVIIATAGHDTTSSSTAGGILALIENPDQLSKLKNNPNLMTSAVEETISEESPSEEATPAAEEATEEATEEAVEEKASSGTTAAATWADGEDPWASD